MCIIVSVKKSTKVTSKSKTPVSKAKTTKTTKVTKSPKITEKAGNVIIKPKRGSTSLEITPNPNSFYNLITGELPDISKRPKDLIALNTGYVAISNNKNASTIANVPVKLYFNQSSSSIKSTAHKAVSDFDFKHIKKSFNSPVIKQMENASDIVEIVEHPLLDLLSVINNSMNYVDFVSMEQEYLGLIGNAYTLVKYNKDSGLPSSLYPLLSENVVVVADNGGLGKVVSYKYANGKKTKEYKAQDVIHFLNYSPGSNLLGKGELEQVLSPVARYNYYDAFESYVNANYGRADFIIAYQNKMSKKDLDEAYRQWKKRLGGKNIGSPVVSAGNFEIKNTGLSPKDMQWTTGRRAAILEIINAYGIPESMVKLNSSNLASAMVATNQYYLFTVFPKLAKFLAKLNETLVPMYNQSGLFLWYDSRIPTNAVAQSQMILAQLAAQVITVEEARQQLGYDPNEIQSAQEGSGRVKE